MPGSWIRPTLLALVLTACLVSSADARKSGWWHFFGFYGHGYTSHPGDDGRRTRAAETVHAKTVGAVIDRLIRGCVQQASALQNWPFDKITQIVVPDDAQRGALETLRASAIAGAKRLSGECPQDELAPPGDRLEAVQQSSDAVSSTFATIEPPLRAFYAALDDEQKARLLRELTLSGTHAGEGDRAARRSERRGRQRGDAARGANGNAWDGICERLTAALRGWPIRQIDRSVHLSEAQRGALYELVNSSLRAADTLESTCPAETALTPPIRLATMRARLAAVRQATVAIRPALTQFYETLDQRQKVRFAGMR